MPAQDIIRLTPEDIQEVMDCPRETAEEWADPLSGSAVIHGITTHKRMAPWLATIAHESAGLTRLQESLQYSAKRLTEVWSGRFRFPKDGESGDLEVFRDGMRNAYQYANHPEKLANYVYDDANRSPQHALGNTHPGDGWAFIGRGPGQLTGRWNYERFKASSGIDVVRFPDLLLEPSVGAMSVGWIWQDKGCNELADEDRFEDIVRKYNGGLTGYTDRVERLHLAQNVLGLA